MALGGIVMFSRNQVVAVMLGLSTVVAAAQQFDWPPLPKAGFISGRIATEKDVAERNAVFAPKASGTIAGKSRAIDIVIPQYAYVRDDKTGARRPAVIVQAEETQALQVVGVRFTDAPGQAIHALESIELLGTKPPK